MWGHRFRSLSIRGKLLALVLLPLAGVLPLLGVLLLWGSGVALDRLLITKIRSDLAVAQGYFERVMADVAASTRAVARSHELAVALGTPDPGALARLLSRVRDEAGLDYINLRRPDGSLWLTGDGSAPDGVAPATGDDEARVERLDVAEQALLPASARVRVPVPLLPTRNAAPSERTIEDRALVLQATQPVVAGDGRVLGHVQAGLLLNRNLDLIDRINGVVYPDGALPFGSRGTATLFLDDVRISTNVRLFGAESEQRAIGTRVSQAVRDAVLGRGQTWLDRAFVVDEWYVSAYEPLVDGRGRRVGMLYVGFLEGPFTVLKYAALAGLGVVFFAVMIAATLVSLRWARAVFQPVERMEATMRAAQAGEPRVRVGPLASDDELGRLAGHLDELLDRVEAHTEELEHSNALLDAKVAQRTSELADAQSQLLRSERLATVGQLTASIAHEINNPIAVIQGNLDLLREQLPPEAVRRVRTELALADAQVERMRLIVTQLLQFSRPGEYAGYVAPVDVDAVVADCLVLVHHLLSKTHIAVSVDRGATRRPAINRQELQQVLVNLMVNAIHAMPDGGRLEVATRDDGDDAVCIDVADSGPGLDAELMDQLFKPFVTRKKDGTGLGLWISRSLVERYGGSLVAANRAPGGACFTVRLPVEGGL